MSVTSKHNAMPLITRWAPILLVVVVMITGALYIVRSGDFNFMSIAQQIAAPWFVRFYAGLLVVVTFWIIIRCEARLSRERTSAKRIVDILVGRETPEIQLRILNRIVDARIISNEFCRTDVLTTEEISVAHSSSVFVASANILGAITSTPVAQHTLEGLRPAKRVLRHEIQKNMPRAVDVSDFMVRLALLGTFVGLIAALAIASANVGIAQETEQAQSAHVQQFLQQLLASAAAKFWISAVGMGGAITLRLWQVRLDAEVNKLSDVVGLAFDNQLAKPELAKAWCPRRNSELDPVTQQIHDIADQIKKSADRWTLVMEIGANADGERPSVSLIDRG